MFVFGLCFFFFFFFRLCCYDLGLSFWLLDLCSWLLGLICVLVCVLFVYFVFVCFF